MTDKHTPIHDDSRSPVRRLEDSVLTRLRIRRERWEIRRIQMRILVLLTVLLSTLLAIPASLVR